MPPPDAPRDTDRPPSDAEKAMSANARSRDRQGKAGDHARHAPNPNPTGGAEPRAIGPSRARTTPTPSRPLPSPARSR